MPQPIYLTREIREIEQKAGAAPLMERAGAAAAALAASLVPEDRKDILVLAGPGNNGGDARIAAARLQDMFFRVTEVSHPRALPPERSWGLVIDGLFGIGLARNISGDYARARRLRQPAALPGARARRAERHPVRYRPGARLRSARHAHAQLHRAEAGPAHPRRPGPLRRDQRRDARRWICPASSRTPGSPTVLFRQRAQAPAAQFPQGHRRLARHPRRRARHDRRGAARRPRRAEDGRRPRLRRPASSTLLSTRARRS